MGQGSGVSRRSFVKLGGIGLAALSVPRIAWAAPRRQVGHFAQLGVTEALIRQTLATALEHGGDRADLFFQHRVTNYLVLEDGEVNRAYSEVTLGVGIRTVRGDQTGFAYTEDLSPAALKQTAHTVAAIADGPARPAPSSFRVETRASATRYPVKVRWEEVDVARKLPVLQRTNEAILKGDARIKKANLTFNDEMSVILIADSEGRIVEDTQPMTLLYASCVGEEKGRREQNGYNVAARAGFEFYTDERIARVASEAVARTVVLFEAVQPPAGEMPVVLAAGSSGILLHEAIGHGMEADFNRKNTSIYSDKIGKSIAKPFVNIVDDGTGESQRGAINIDDEGAETGRTHLVEDGVLSTYLHDSISAAHYKTKPTGNGRRESYQHAPMPRMRSTYMLPGPHHRDEIIASVKKGILCSNFTNGQVQIGAGDFTFYVKNGYLIEDGKLTRPIKDVNIIGNGPKVLERIDMVSDDLKIDEGGWTCGKNGQSVPVSQGMPTVRVASITVGGVTGKKA
jgi:TldD protein